MFYHEKHKPASNTVVSTPVRRRESNEAQLCRHCRETRESMKSLQFLVDASLLLNSSLDLDEILKVIVQLSTKAVDAERATLYLVDLEREEIWSKILLGDATLEIRMPLGEGIAGTVALSGEELIINDCRTDPRHNKRYDKKSGFVTRNMLCIPVKDQKYRIIGVLQVINKKAGKFQPGDLELEKTLASQAAVAISNAKLARELKKAHYDTLIRLSLAAEFRNTEVAQHINRIRTYSQEIARAMGWSGEDLELLYHASPLHDVGKIGVPDSVLLKPGQFNERERKVMQEHTLIGGKILEAPETRLLEMSRDIALHHHERYDGKGYPFGMAGEEISPISRIVALADVFDALSTPRCYKPAFCQEKVLSIIREERGKQFDPECVDAFFSVYARIKTLLSDDAKVQDAEHEILHDMLADLVVVPS